ncbi:MAG: hypothetical protein J0L61_06390, partial [Planctomycetes bacterium]|nr:hypothetical protein [Planctomycetota bacterium]
MVARHRLDADGHGLGVGVAVLVDEQRAVDPAAVDADLLRQDRGRRGHAEAVDQAVHEGRGLPGVLVDAGDAQHEAPPVELGDEIAQRVEGTIT